MCWRTFPLQTPVGKSTRSCVSAALLPPDRLQVEKAQEVIVLTWWYFPPSWKRNLSLGWIHSRENSSWKNLLPPHIWRATPRAWLSSANFHVAFSRGRLFLLKITLGAKCKFCKKRGKCSCTNPWKQGSTDITVHQHRSHGNCTETQPCSSGTTVKTPSAHEDPHFSPTLVFTSLLLVQFQQLCSALQ